MIRNLVSIGFLAGLLTGCGASSFSAKEAEDVADANQNAMLNAYAAMYNDTVTRSTQSDVVWTDNEDGFTFEGTVSSDGPDWTGSMEVAGTFVYDEDSADWQFSAVYDQVSDGNTTLDGSVDWVLAVDYTDGGLDMVSTVKGDLTATGDSNGSGEIDMTATISVDETGASWTAQGTVGDEEVDMETSYSWGDALEGLF